MRAGVLASLLAVFLASEVSGWSPALVNGSFTQREWTPSSVTLKANLAHGANITGTNAAVQRVVSDALGAWKGVPGLSLVITDGGTTAVATKSVSDGENSILFQDAASQGAVGGALAVTFSQFDSTSGQMSDADIVFNTSFSFSTELPSAAEVDLQSVLTHELGHAFGLDHSSVLAATMFPTATKGESRARTLSEDDRSGLLATYPASATRSTLNGRVRKGGNGVLGAAVFAVDGAGSVVAATVTRGSDGTFSMDGLPAGTYALGVEPLDGPMTKDNLGGFWQTLLGGIDTAFKTLAAAGSFTVAAGGTASVGDLTVTAGASSVNPDAVVDVTDAAASSFTFGNSESVQAGTTGKELVVKHTDGIDENTTVTLSGSDVTLGTPTSGQLQSGEGFRRFPLTVPSNAAVGPRNLFFTKSGETGALVAGLEILEASAATAVDDHPDSLTGTFDAN
ncbi:MAG: matrixin family metalloprotease, partial [Candidatus Wallbacteria bacterium]|nr:matrixin family metalloprotease [Candidatus Wallbacteria bacterium]